MEIITADHSHIQVIRHLAQVIWPPTFKDIISKDQLSYMLEMMYSQTALEEQMMKGHVFVLLKDDDTFYGYLSYEVHYQATSKTKIHKIYVLPHTQGRGGGRQLMDYAAEQAKLSGDTAVTLNVNRFNKALTFYERLGYRQVGSEDIDIGQGFLMEDFILEKIL